MVIYISENINSKKNGGSSLSGYEFLKILLIKYKNVVVITHNNFDSDDENLFYGNKTNKIMKVITVKRKYEIKPFTIKKILKKIFYSITELTKSKSINLENYLSDNAEENLLFVNSWSGIYQGGNIIGTEKFKKICIVRGSPESFVWQSFENDKDKVVRNAALYLEQFNNLIFVSSNGLIAWDKLFSKPISSFYLPNSINEFEVKKISEISVTEAKAKLGMREEDINIIVVGSIQKRKAQDILLNVIQELVKVFPNIKFHLVGNISDTWGGDKIYRDIVSSEYKKYFIFHGHSNEQLLFMKAGDVLLFTSRAEAFPRTVAEYMATGKPIVAADVSGVNEMIQHKQNGLLYDPFEPKQLLNCLIKLINDNELQRFLAKNAKEIYYLKFNKEKHIIRALEIFEKINANYGLTKA